MTRQEVQGLVERIRGVAVSPVLAHFISEAPLSDEEIQELRELLETKRAQQGPPRKRATERK